MMDEDQFGDEEILSFLILRTIRFFLPFFPHVDKVFTTVQGGCWSLVRAGGGFFFYTML
jgi:hypothetical protein